MTNLTKLAYSLLSGEPIHTKDQISIDEFLRSKGIYNKGARISFGRFLVKFYQEKKGRKPKKSYTIVNGKEVLTYYYTEKDRQIIEEAFAEWRNLNKMLGRG